MALLCKGANWWYGFGPDVSSVVIVKDCVDPLYFTFSLLDTNLATQEPGVP